MLQSKAKPGIAGKVADRSAHLLDRLRQAPAELTLVALVLTVIAVIATKAYTGRGTPLRGGLPSGHAALAFAGAFLLVVILIARRLKAPRD